jgi:hypothetical protein
MQQARQKCHLGRILPGPGTVVDGFGSLNLLPNWNWGADRRSEVACSAAQPSRIMLRRTHNAYMYSSRYHALNARFWNPKKTCPPRPQYTTYTCTYEFLSLQTKENDNQNNDVSPHSTPCAYDGRGECRKGQAPTCLPIEPSSLQRPGPTLSATEVTIGVRPLRE